MGREPGAPEPIAIVGIAALYPEARDAAQLWRLLSEQAPSDPDGAAQPARTLDDIRTDPARFGIPPAQARSIARMQFLMLETARQCLTDAGQAQDSLSRDRTDVIVGVCGGLDRQYANALRVEGAHYGRDLGRRAAAEDPGGTLDAERVTEEFRAALRSRIGASTHDRVGEMASAIPARVASVCKLRGRTLALESADATSYLGLAHAMDSLRGGLSDAVLVLAGQLDEGPFLGRALAGMGLPAPAEGVGGLLLKRLSTAEADGDRVYASLLGCGLGHEARSGVFRYPTSDDRRSATAAAVCREAGIAPGTVQYVDWAGGGLPGEAERELDALGALFGRDGDGDGKGDGDGSAGAREPSAPVVLGSVRERLGPTLANSGLAGVSKVALALHHRALPPSRADAGAGAVEDWPEPDGGVPRRAAVGGASLTGSVCHVLLEEHVPAERERTQSASRASVRPAAPRAAAVAAAAPEPVAIVGYGGRFADAADAEAYWQVMCGTRDRIGPLPEELLDRELFHAPRRMSLDHSYLDAGSPVAVPEAPPPGVRIPPRRYATLDAAQRLALDVAAEAFTRYAPGPAGMTGDGIVAIGSSLSLGRERRLAASLCLDQLDAVAAELASLEVLGPDLRDGLVKLTHEHRARHQAAESPMLLGGALAGGVPALLANEYGLAATPVAVEAACASSLAALDLAVSRLRAGSADYAIAGGVELPCNTRDMVLCSALGLLSHDRITPFGASADGFTPGDGCGLFLLKRYADARRDGDRVYGLLRSVGSANDVKSQIAPDAAGQARAMEQAFAQVEFPPAAVDYLEAHGTGTRVGDRAEIEAVTSVYATDERPRALHIGTAKAYIGHTFAAAGAAGLLRALQAIGERTIPANAGLTAPHPELPLAAIPAHIATRTAPWEAPGGPRRAAVSSFGTGGINYHLLIEEAENGDPTS